MVEIEPRPIIHRVMGANLGVFGGVDPIIQPRQEKPHR